MFFEFEKPFSGTIFAKGHFASNDCKIQGNGSKAYTLVLPINTDKEAERYCGVRLADDSIYSVELIVSELPNILILGLEEFEIRCEYKREEEQLDTPTINKVELRVHWPGNSEILQGTAASANSIAGLPTSVNLTIRDGHGITGPLTQQAFVGDKITLDIFFTDGGMKLCLPCIAEAGI